MAFICANCGHVLIENYIEADFVSVEIKCFRCGTFTTTPAIEPGEIFSLRLLNMGHEGAFRINGTIDTWPGIFITCDQALRSAVDMTSPRSEGITWELSVEGLNSLVDRYNTITGDRFSIQDKIVSKTGDREALKFPFAWSVRHLRSCLEERVINIDDPKTHYSFTWIRVFVDIVGRWQHHPRFQTIAKDLGKPDSFLHTAAQFIVASYLAEHGNWIGLALEDLHGEANPDLYIRADRDTRIYLEVKSPKALHRFGPPVPGELVLEAPVKACIEGSVKQINKHRRGALVMFSSLQDRRAPAELVRCVTNWLNRSGRNRKSLAAVVTVSAVENRLARNGTTIEQPLTFQITPVLNPHFEGKNPIITGR